MCFMLMTKQRLPLVRKISCHKLTTNKTSECFNNEVIQRLPRIPRSILVPKTLVDNPKILNTSLNVCRPSFSIKNDNEQINITWGSTKILMIIYIVATWIDLHSFTPLCHHVPYLHPSAFLDHKVAFVNRIRWPASALPYKFPLLRKLRPLHCFLWPLWLHIQVSSPQHLSSLVDTRLNIQPCLKSSITLLAGFNRTTITSNKGGGGGEC